MSEIDLARKIFNSSMYAANGGSNSRYQTGSYSTGSSTGNSGTFGSSSTRKGTVISVDGNMAEVRLDGSSATIRGNIETPVAVGQRVSAIFDGRTYVFVALSEFVTQTQNKFLEIAEDLQETKDEILADVADDIASVNDSVTEAVSKADEAAQKADAASSSVTEITTTVNGLEEEVAGYSTQISSAVETANSARTQATAAQTDLNGFKTTVSQTYSTKTELDDAIEQEVLDRNSAITQSANSIKSEVSETYQVKGDYATSADINSAIAQEVLDRNSAIEQSASEITSTVSQNYQSKTDAGTMEQELQAQITQNATAIQTEVTNRTQAVSNAITESKSYTDQQADSITQTVETNVMDTVGQTYATKTELAQAEDSITSTVEETVMNEVGNTYATKLEVQQTSTQWGIQLEAVEGKADTAQETATTAKNTADTAKSTADTAKGTADTAKETAEGAASAANDAMGYAEDVRLECVTTANNAAKTATDFMTYDAEGLHIGHSGINQELLLAPQAIQMTGTSPETAQPLVMTQIEPNKAYFGDPTISFAKLSDYQLQLFGENFGTSYTTYEEWEEDNIEPLSVFGCGEIKVGSFAMVGGHYTGFELYTTEGGASRVYIHDGMDIYNFEGHEGDYSIQIGGNVGGKGWVNLYDCSLNLSGSNSSISLSGTDSKLKYRNGYILQGAITRECTKDYTLTGTNEIIQFENTVEEFDPESILYAAPNYIRVQKPTWLDTVYVEVSFNVQLNGLLAGQNASAQLYKGTTTSTTACTVQREVLQTPGGGFANLTLPPYIVPCTSTFTYFFIKAKCTGGGATIQGGADYAPIWTVRVIGGE